MFPLQVVSLLLLKLSAIMFYRRIFCSANRGWFHITTVIMAVIVLAWGLAFFFAFLFQCRLKFWANWSTALNVLTYCDNTTIRSLAYALSDFITDLLVLLLPLPMVRDLERLVYSSILLIPQIWRLKLSTKKKVAVTGAFLLGAL